MNRHFPIGYTRPYLGTDPSDYTEHVFDSQERDAMEAAAKELREEREDASY